MSRAAPKSSRICPKKRGDCAPSGDRLSDVQVVLECVLLPFGALGDRHLATLMGHPSQDGAAVKQVTFTPDGKQEHLGNS
jgi:hypothetical protein